MRFLLPLLLSTGALVAQVGPNYERPATATPERFKGVAWREARPASHQPKGEWWKLFRDPKLNELMVSATANNQNLKAAISRFDQARATARMARADLFPVLSMPLSADRQRTSENAISPIPLNGLFYEGPSYNAVTDLSWELDLFGKIRRGAEAGRADAQAAADAVHNILLGIQADVATNYFRMRVLDQEIRLVREAIGLRGEAFKIAKARVEAGAGSELEQAQSETEVATAEAETSTLQSQRDQLENAIAILLGANAASFRIPASGSSLYSPPALPVGAPSDLLERRPDVSQAERALAAATARIGVAKAMFFPSIKLIGRGGFQSADIDLLMQPESLIYSYGPSINIPLFSGGKNVFNLNKAKAQHDEALAGYRLAFLTAVADVENSLSSIRHLAVSSEAQQRARNSAERAASLARTRYESGTSPYLDVIEANRTTLATQRATVQVAGQRLIASVSLIKALGGGWDQTQPVIIPAIVPDPAARFIPEEKTGFFSKVKGIFNKKEPVLP
ncbi:multidrug efflux system outer membrane protein [Prosthecobacter fusiformis]|uniref:Multidrug efflux system outer membrane protein n=1 Tax=Prosthecobacter fusiformis TaxID=48464 RepID=A0A4R7RXS7_9BACT|nr:efflux transporter outer membrane subunit [Prosthecobacter fusiformis]TDU70601.1 multidrug efflux system outer membrane protein [Prosthecobacter fusiformis]